MATMTAPKCHDCGASENLIFAVIGDKLGRLCRRCALGGEPERQGATPPAPPEPEPPPDPLYVGYSPDRRAWYLKRDRR